MTAGVQHQLVPLSMSADAAIRFRDPFASRPRSSHLPNYKRPSYYDFPQSRSVLTPSPDMNGVAQTSKLAYNAGEQGQHYGDYLSYSSAHRAVTTHAATQEPPNVEYASQSTSQRAAKPASPRQPIFDDGQSSSRRSSIGNTIAPSFQIPRSVNDSGGSLSELAAEITCLFWFESAEVLQLVEDSVLPVTSKMSLSQDARPSTGFRKWVTTILSTTLVAQNVVLLALLFVYRLKKLNPTVRGKPGSEYRLLTVALMLGNKFLDDNTYTNKTWAEVSGINVAEVHIMEVEFLSNMKYCLFTSAEDWSSWQSLLGRFAAFVDQAKNRPQVPPAPILPPAPSLYLPAALPSPPSSNQASPPYVVDHAQNRSGYNVASGVHGPTPAPSPLAPLAEGSSNRGEQNRRKRSHDELLSEPAPKRQAAYSSYQPNQPAPRLALPSLPIPTSSASATRPHAMNDALQLPPLTVPARAMAMVYPSANSQQHTHQSGATSASQSLSQSQLQHQSRQHSPFPGSAGGSPTSAMAPAATALHPNQISPNYYLRQRNSPYRPVYNVSTLLYPPPSGALYQRPQNVEFNQMHYQPLGKSIQQRQAGRLPYVSQNVWLDDNEQQAMTPVDQWPGFSRMYQPT